MTNPLYPEGVTEKDIDRIGEPKDGYEMTRSEDDYLIKDLVKTLEEAYRIIEDVEWEGYSAIQERMCCPFCREIPPEHFKDCKLKKFLDDRGKL
jgi:hypothetical protein